MSTFKVEVVKIDSVTQHPNADRLDLIRIRDWQCVAQRDTFHNGSKCVYFPIDSVLPTEVESRIFGKNSKIKLNNSRVRTIKLRGALSQGLAVPVNVFPDLEIVDVGDDVTSFLGVTKFEPPTKLSGASNNKAATKKQCNPNFRKYTGIENAKNYPSLFEEGEMVSVTEKIHGSNFRAGYVPFYADTIWKKLKKLIELAPQYEFVFGSHNIQLQSKLLYKGYYDTNIYAEAVEKYKLKDILKPGEVLYGEIYGPNIQKGYHYGMSEGHRGAVFFDLMTSEEYMDTISFRKWAEARSLPVVPELYRGPFNKEKVYSLRDGDSVFNKTQKVREGVVVKPLVETISYAGRKVLKYISDEYLLRNQDNESEPH